MMSRVVEKSIDRGEKMLEYFSICGRYLKVQIVLHLLKWLFIFLLVAIGFLLLDQTQLIATPANKAIEIDSSQKSFLEEKSFSDTLFKNLNLEVSQEVINVWTILGLVYLLIVTPIIMLYNLFYLRISNEFVFTDQRIIVKKGWIETSVKTISYEKITDVSVSQSILDRIIKSGTLSISTAGSDGYEAVLPNINKPYKLKKSLYDIKENYQKKNGNN